MLYLGLYKLLYRVFAIYLFIYFYFICFSNCRAIFSNTLNILIHANSTLKYIENIAIFYTMHKCSDECKHFVKFNDNSIPVLHTD